MLLKMKVHQWDGQVIFRTDWNETSHWRRFVWTPVSGKACNQLLEIDKTIEHTSQPQAARSEELNPGFLDSPKAQMAKYRADACFLWKLCHLELGPTTDIWTPSLLDLGSSWLWTLAICTSLKTSYKNKQGDCDFIFLYACVSTYELPVFIKSFQVKLLASTPQNTCSYLVHTQNSKLRMEGGGN